MIFISIKIFIFLILCAVGCVAGIGIYGYNLLMEYGNKASAELVFFVSLCIIIVMLIGFFSAVVYSKTKKRELNRITKLARVNGIFATKRFSKFGSFGKQLQLLFEDILNISEMRSVRIAYLSNTISTICNEISKPILIVDISGTIQYVSNGFIKKLSDEDKSVVGLHILDVYSEINFDEVLAKLKTSGSECSEKFEKITLKFLPIFTKNNALAGLFIFVEKNSIFSQGTEAVKQIYETSTHKEASEEDFEKIKIKAPENNKVEVKNFTSKLFSKFKKEKK